MPKAEIENKERIFRKTVTQELGEKTFTTESKHKPRTTIKISRKGNIVKEKCRQLTEIALGLFPDRIISHEDLVFLVLSYVGGNRDTVRAYIGYLGRRIGSSYGNVKWIGKSRKGYLETFGFMTHKGLKWIIHAQSQLFPPNPPLSISECVSKNYSKEKISLSHSGNDYTVANSLTNGGSDVVESREKRERERDTARERNFTPMIFGKIENTTDKNLGFLERLAKAKPSEEPDRSTTVREVKRK